MSSPRASVKLDFTSGMDRIPVRPPMDAATTLASAAAGRELGFSSRVPTSLASARIDGRRLRSRGANTQLNLKVTADEKELILREAARHIQNPESAISNVGEFVFMAVEFYRKQSSVV